MDEEFYEAPCRALLRERVSCEGCGKELTRHCLLYRHDCVPTEERRATYDLAVKEVAQQRRATYEREAQMQQRAQTKTPERSAQQDMQTKTQERRGNYANLLKW